MPLGVTKFLLLLPRPPKVPSNDYLVKKSDEKELLITEEEYVQRYKTGELEKYYKTSPEILNKSLEINK